jgi:peptidoglycan/xylan/chitin deacetylase (PgdA/CDA1 family)
VIRGGARFFARVLWVTGLAAVLRRFVAARGRFAIEFHGVPGRAYPELPSTMRPSLTGANFERVLHWVSRRFRFLTVDQFLESDRPGVLLTFDDGFANNHDVVLPLLKKFEAPAVFFVATQHIGDGGRWLGFAEDAARLVWGDPAAVPVEASRDLYDGMGREQLTACAASGLVTIGAHTVSHPRLTALDDKKLTEEIRRSKTVLEDLTGRPVDLFAYPFGDADVRVSKAVGEAGFRAAFVEGQLPIEPPHMAIPRIGIHQPEPWYLAAKLSGIREHLLTAPGKDARP